MCIRPLHAGDNALTLLVFAIAASMLMMFCAACVHVRVSTLCAASFRDWFHCECIKYDIRKHRNKLYVCDQCKKANLSPSKR